MLRLEKECGFPILISRWNSLNFESRLGQSSILTCVPSCYQRMEVLKLQCVGNRMPFCFTGHAPECRSGLSSLSQPFLAYLSRVAGNLVTFSHSQRFGGISLNAGLIRFAVLPRIFCCDASKVRPLPNATQSAGSSASTISV